MIFIMRGTSCSGKDRFIKQTFGADCGHVLSSDMFRAQLTGSMSKQDHNQRVFELMSEFLETRLLNGAEYTVINATNLRMKDTKRFIDAAKEHHSKITMISIAPPSETELQNRAIKRANEGGLAIPESVITKHFERYETCKNAFLKEAVYNDLFSFIEVDQEYEVINHVQ